MNLFSRLSLRRKLLFMAALPALGLLTLSVYEGAREWQAYSVRQQHSQLLALSRPYQQLAQELATERGIRFGLSGETGIRMLTPLNEQRKQTDRTIEQVRAVEKRLLEVQIDTADIRIAVQRVSEQLNALAPFRVALPAQRYESWDEVAPYSDAIAAALELERIVFAITRASESSRWILLLEKELELFLAIGRKRALGMWILHKEEVTPAVGRSFMDAHLNFLSVSERLAEVPDYEAFREAMNLEFLLVNQRVIEQVIEEVEHYLSNLNRFRFLQSQLGYGGLIHTFKNFVLRGEPRYQKRFEREFEGLSSSIREHLQNTALSKQVRDDLQTILRVMSQYQQNLDLVAKGYQAGLSVPDIDARVKVDDAPALLAMRELFTYQPTVSAEEWFRLQTYEIGLYKRLIQDSQLALQEVLRAESDAARRFLLTQVLFTSLLLGALVVIFLAISHDTDRALRKMLGGLRAITDQGDLDVMLPTDRRDEIGEVSTALQRLVGETRRIISQVRRIGLGDYDVEIQPRSAQDALLQALAQMAGDLKSLSQEQRVENQLRERLVETARILREAGDSKQAEQRLLKYVACTLEADIGILYLADAGGDRYPPALTTGVPASAVAPVQFGDGLIGECIASNSLKVVGDMPTDYPALTAGLGRAEMSSLVIVPLWSQGNPVGALELARRCDFPPADLHFLEEVREPAALGLLALKRRAQLEQSVAALEERKRALLAREEELSELNLELKAQAENLQASEEELKAANEELELSSQSLRQNQQRLEQQARELEQASKYKSEFLANISHELRTPMNSILILSKSLAENRDGNLTEKQVASSRVIAESGQSLLELINDILDMSKVEAGMLQIRPDHFDIDTLIVSLQNVFSPLAQKNALQFVVEKQQEVPAQWYSDHQRVGQILRNFLSNAMKFTREGNVTLQVSTETSEARVTRLRFDVRDTGIGIADDQKEAIFRAFQQEDGSTSREFGGTGLGLTISLNLAAMLGGEILCESTKGAGSTFTLLIPAFQGEGARHPQADLQPASQLQATSNSPVASTPNAQATAARYPEIAEVLNECKVMIVDDDLRNGFALSAELRHYGVYVLLAKDGRQCLQKLEDHPETSAIITDLMMPGMDGYQLLEKLRGNRLYDNLPIIVLTARQMADDRSRCLELGANDYLVKPVDMDCLTKSLARLLGGKAA